MRGASVHRMTQSKIERYHRSPENTAASLPIKNGAPISDVGCMRTLGGFKLRQNPLSPQTPLQRHRLA